MSSYAPTSILGLILRSILSPIPRTRTNDISFVIVGRLNILSGSTICVKYDSQTDNPVKIIIKKTGGPQ